MLGTLTSAPSTRRSSGASTLRRKVGGQPGNTNARRHGLYAARDPHPYLRSFSHILSLRQSAIFAARAGQLGLAQMYVQGLQELLLQSFLAVDLSRLTPQTFIQLDRFYRTVSATLRAKRALKQLLDEQSFLPDLARQALPLCTAEFTDRRISPYAYYAQANESFVPHLLQKKIAR